MVCALAVVYIVPHVWWALGISAAFPGDQDDFDEAFGRTWFFVYNLVDTVLAVIAAFIALALIQPWGRTIPRRPLVFCAWAGAAILTLRGTVGLVQSLLLVTDVLSPRAEGHSPNSRYFWIAAAWEAMFLVWGIALGATARLSHHRERNNPLRDR
ncbi:MAG: DUF3995 domain-containing protein [Thermomicrobiales bacterium]